MDWVFDNIQILIAIAAGIAFWLNKRHEDREQRRRMEDEGPAEWEEEEFGPGETVVTERPVTPTIVIHQRATPPPLPPSAPAEVTRQQEMLERLKTLRAQRAAQTAAKKPSAQAKNPAAGVPGGLQSRLRDRGEIRRAIVLREILGPPVGLR